MDKKQVIEVSDVIETVYDAVFDRSRFDELVDLASDVLENPEAKARFDMLQEVLERHLKRAESLLQSLPQEAADQQKVPIFELNALGEVETNNDLATALLGIRKGMYLADLPLPEETDQSLKAFLSHKEATIPVLRLTRLDSNKPYLVFAQISPHSDTPFPITFTGTDCVWTDLAATAFQNIFKLTPSETEILGHLMAGQAPTDIADLRSRSIDTIRQQIKTVTRKTCTSGIQELLYLARTITQSTQHLKAGAERYQGRAKRTHHRLSDGRIMDYALQGADKGKTVLFIHGCLCGNILPQAASDYLSTKNLRLLAPARPDHGQSSTHDRLVQDPAHYAADLIELLDHLTISKAHLVGFDVGAIFALRAAHHLQDRLHGITCISAHPPVTGLRDIASMPTQQRIFTIMPKVSLPLLRFLAKAGDRRLKKDGIASFPETVFKGATADLKACEDAELLQLFWEGHLFHVENSSNGFISDCRIAASDWFDGWAPPNCPITLIHGEENATIPPSRIQPFAQSLNANLHILPDAGHTLPFTHWQAMFDHILKNHP